MGLGRHDQAIALGDERLKLLDGDEDALRMKMEIEADRGDFTAARGWAQKLIDQGKENAGLLNNIAWYALFTGKVADADIAAAIKSAQLAKDDPSILHTLACLYAETGKTKEAHDLLLGCMENLNLNQWLHKDDIEVIGKRHNLVERRLRQAGKVEGGNGK